MDFDDLSNLQEAGTEIDPMGDLNTESEKKLGRLVREKYVDPVSLKFYIFIYSSGLMSQLFVLFTGMVQTFSFSIGIHWLFARSIRCLVMTTQLTAIRLMFSFEVNNNNIVNLITDST